MTASGSCLGTQCEDALPVLAQAEKMLDPCDSAEKRALLLEIRVFPHKNTYVTAEQFEQLYRYRFRLPCISPNDAVHKLWAVEKVVAEFAEVQAQAFLSVKTFASLFTMRQNAEFLNDNILRRIAHHSLPGRFEVVYAENGKLETLLTNVGNFACYSQFYGFTYVSKSSVLFIGIVSCEREWHRFNTQTAEDVLEETLNATVAESRNVMAQIKEAVYECEFASRELLGQALKRLIGSDGCMDEQLSQAKRFLSELLDIFEIPRFREMLSEANRINESDTIYAQMQCLQKICQMVSSYVKNSNLERFSRGEEAADLRGEFRKYLQENAVNIVEQGPEELRSRACLLSSAKGV